MKKEYYQWLVSVKPKVIFSISFWNCENNSKRVVSGWVSGPGDDSLTITLRRKGNVLSITVQWPGLYSILYRNLFRQHRQLGSKSRAASVEGGETRSTTHLAKPSAGVKWDFFCMIIILISDCLFHLQTFWSWLVTLWIWKMGAQRFQLPTSLMLNDWE